mmetsp:Transcript_12219/g.31142  ORF Transcript_12219/g.31142 Transcript_12219/m.31142 type:complete len:259 (+) Transcript_12219:3-779(+)
MQARFEPEAASEAQTEDLFSRSISIRKRLLGENHLDTAEVYFGLARFYLHLKRLEEARELFTMVAKIKRNLLGDAHPDVIQVEYNIAILEMEAGNYGKAESLFDTAISNWCRTLGDDHVFVATAWQTKSRLLARTGRLGEAAAALRTCLAIREKRFEPTHLRLLDAKKELAAVEARIKEEADGAASAGKVKVGEADRKRSFTRKSASKSHATKPAATAKQPTGTKADSSKGIKVAVKQPQAASQTNGKARPKRPCSIM